MAVTDNFENLIVACSGFTTISPAWVGFLTIAICELRPSVSLIYGLRASYFVR